MEWIKNLSIGDKVWQLERHKLIHNGYHKWKGVVTIVETNYIEVKWYREPIDWLEDLRVRMKKGSSTNIDSTYSVNYTKNYFSPAGEINIEK